MAKDKKVEEKPVPVEKKETPVEYASDGLRVDINHKPDVDVKR